MNKGELIELLANEKGTTKADAERTVNFIFENFKTTLCQGGGIQIAGFGNFTVKRRKARMGRNPQTKEPIQIPASNTVGFKASKTLKEALQGGSDGAADAVAATAEAAPEVVSEPAPETAPAPVPPPEPAPAPAPEAESTDQQP